MDVSIALGIGIAVIILLVLLAAYARRKKHSKDENPLARYAHGEMNTGNLLRRIKDMEGKTALTTAKKGGYMRMTVKDKVGHDLLSYETHDPDEQMKMLELRRPLAKSGVHARRMRANTQYLSRKVKRLISRD